MATYYIYILTLCGAGLIAVVAAIYFCKYWVHYIFTFCFAAITFIPALIFFRRPFVQEYMGYFYARIASLLLGIKVEVRGAENKSDSPSVYVLNHQSSIDIIPTFYIKPKNTNLIGKREIAFVPLFGWTFYCAGNILIDRGSAKKSSGSIDYSAEAIHRRKVSILVFAEGTRNLDGKIHPFKQGAFRIASQAGVPITPVVVSSYTNFLDKKKKRWRRGKMIIQILPQIASTGNDKTAAKDLSIKVYDKMNEAFNQINAELASQ